MNQIDLIKTQMNKPIIDRLSTSGNKIYVRYIEQYQNFEVPMKTDELVKALQTEGANTIQVLTDIIVDDLESEDRAYKLMKRIERIAEKAGYYSGLKVISQHYRQGNIKKEWNEISGNLLRKVAI
jgi:hypothetical protein